MLVHCLQLIILIIFFSVVLCRMKMLKMKKAGRYGVGFIDPNSVNEEVWDRHGKETEENLLKFLLKLNTEPEILFPYIYG